MTATLSDPILDTGHYATQDRRNPQRHRVQLYRVDATETGLDIYAEYGRSKPRRVARWSASLGLVAVGDNGHSHYALVTEIFAAPTSAQALYAATTGHCARCNRPLEREDSRAAGLGAHCRSQLTHAA